MTLDQLTELEGCYEDLVLDDPEYYIDEFRFVVEVRTTTQNMAVEDVVASDCDLSRLQDMYVKYCCTENPVFQEFWDSLPKEECDED